MCSGALFSLLFRVVFEELVKVAGDHSVVELAHFIRLPAVEFLEAGVRSDDIYLPRRERAEVLAELAIELLYLG